MNVSKKSLGATALGALLPAMLALAPLAAHAGTATITVAGATPGGTDPFGDSYTIGPFGGGLTEFNEGAGQQSDPTKQPLFDPGATGLKDITSFTITETGGDKFIALSKNFGISFQTYQANDDILSNWKVTESADGTSLTFTPKKAKDDLLPGQRFSIDATFKNALPANFTYTLSYTGGVPEPAAWGLMMLGLGLIGGALRQDRKRMAPAAV